MTTPPIAFVDTETTEVGHRRLAWELAIIRRDVRPDGTVDRKELQTFIEIDLADASPFALRVGRFHERHPLGRFLAGGVQPGNMLPRPGVGDYANVTAKFDDSGHLKSALGLYFTQAEAAALWCRWTHGAHIVGAVPNFDTEVMAAAARATGLLPSHHYHLIDVENLVVGYLRGQLDWLVADDPTRASTEALCTPPWKSDDLMAAIGVTVPEDERHTALGDARMAERVYDVVMGVAA